MNESTRERGQVLVLFTLMLVVFLGMAALAIDVSGLYSEQRHERAVADAAALAGASDNFRIGSNTVDSAEYTKARTHAMQNLVSQLAPSLGPTLPTCAGRTAPYAVNVFNCRIGATQYYVSIQAPSPSCASGACDPIRSVQVTVRNPSFGLTFARVFGQFAWNVPITSVAERNRGTDYTFVTLRPPKPSRNNDPSCSPDCDQNDGDILLAGTNTNITLVDGDMGTNTNMTLTGGATVILAAGQFVDRYDSYTRWTPPPPARRIAAPIPDPNYNYPAPPANLSDPAQAAINYATNSDGLLSASDCATEAATPVLIGYGVTSTQVAAGEVVCYKPGSYNATNQPVGGNELNGQVTTMIFTPGVYFFNGGLTPGQRRVIGGYQPGSKGVAFWFPKTCNPSCNFAGNTANLVALNAGTQYTTTGRNNSGTPASAAQNWDLTYVQTNTTTPLPMTLLVAKDPLCVVGTTDTCPNASENANKQISLPGSANIFVFGVQYAPTDNVAISGGSGSDGYLGQTWAWTVTYTGGSRITLVGAGDPQPGVLRIATACSPGEACTNPEATTVILP